jgi:hypothetical protein
MKAAGGVVLSLTLACILSGCASTSITSQADVTAKTTYDTVMVIAAFEDLDMRKLGEHEMKEHLAAHGVLGVPSSELFFPGNSYSEGDVQAKLSEHHIEGILVLYASGGDAVPPTYYTRGAEWVSGAGSVSHASHRAKFQAELIDVRTDRSIWVATASSEATYIPVPSPTPQATGHTLLRSFCGQVMNQLVSDGVVNGATNPWLPVHEAQ